MSDKILNFNVGILGHVDSGKTTLAKALSTVASTAAFDKNPQSKERGITLDLGFSSFQSESPSHIKDNFETIQYTLVDCPGHASLIRTIIGGAQIIDLMILVVDIVKGVQTQTAECLVIGEITCSKMMVVLNKVDLLPSATRDASIQKMTKKMKATLSQTKFKDAPIVAVAAKNGDSSDKSIGIDSMIVTLKDLTFIPARDPGGPFVFSVDHCFTIKGQGTVMTGTVLSGSVLVNSNIEISALKEVRKVKSIQMFRKPSNQVVQGDRAGICVTQFDAKLMERGLVSSPGLLPIAHAVIVNLKKIRFFKGDIVSGSKFHISLGHTTVVSVITLFSEEKLSVDDTFSMENEFSYVGSHSEMQQMENAAANLYGLIEFDHCTVIPPHCKIVGSRLETDVHTSSCRLAFEGLVLVPFTSDKYKSEELPKLKVFKLKEKVGVAERANSDFELIGKNMFKKETNIHLFDGFKVKLTDGYVGKMDGPFGQSGKFKIRLEAPLSDDVKSMLGNSKKKKGGETSETPKSTVELRMSFKKYIFSKKIVQ